MHTTRAWGKVAFRCSARLLPTNPAPPVMRMLSGAGLISGNARRVDFLQDFAQAVAEFPFRIMLLKLAHVADPPDVVADAIVLDVGPFELFTTNAFAFVDGLEHGADGVAAAAEVVNFARARFLVEVPERLLEI